MAKPISEDTNQSEFNAFWEASTYNKYNIKEFAAAQEMYASKDKVDSLLEYPEKPAKLVLPKSKANYLAKRRKSRRTFSAKPLSKKEFGLLLSSFYAYDGLEHRAYPSAGASYALEVFCITNNVEGFKHKILYYNPDIHAVNTLGTPPDWDELSKNVNVLCEGVPQVVIIFVLFSNRLTAKYLERGGRFALIEAGGAMQQLAVQIAGTNNLHGVAAGGLTDPFWLKLLGLDESDAKIALGYLCGK